MKKLIIAPIIALTILGLIKTLHAQNVINASIETPTKWTSKDSTEDVTINNGSGNNLTITITVDKPIIVNTQGKPTIVTPAGINIKNCGDTKHIEAGSSAVCTTKDAANPVTFSSDSQHELVSGSYVIKQMPKN